MNYSPSAFLENCWIDFYQTRNKDTILCYKARRLQYIIDKKVSLSGGVRLSQVNLVFLFENGGGTKVVRCFVYRTNQGSYPFILFVISFVFSNLPIVDTLVETHCIIVFIHTLVVTINILPGFLKLYKSIPFQQCGKV